MSEELAWAHWWACPWEQAHSDWLTTPALTLSTALARHHHARLSALFQIEPCLPPPPAPAAAPPFAFAKPVFDETWATIGLGVGMVPSYAGSNDYIAFPLPLIVGRVGGVGIAPNGPGFVLDVNSPKPAMGPRKGARLAFGPAFRFRNDRNNRIRDEVVARADKLDAALEVGGNVAVSFPGVFKPFDSLSIGVQARADVPRCGAFGRTCQALDKDQASAKLAEALAFAPSAAELVPVARELVPIAAAN